MALTLSDKPDSSCRTLLFELVTVPDCKCTQGSHVTLPTLLFCCGTATGKATTQFYALHASVSFECTNAEEDLSIASWGRSVFERIINITITVIKKSLCLHTSVWICQGSVVLGKNLYPRRQNFKTCSLYAVVTFDQSNHIDITTSTHSSQKISF